MRVMVLLSLLGGLLCQGSTAGTRMPTPFDAPANGSATTFAHVLSAETGEELAALQSRLVVAHTVHVRVAPRPAWLSGSEQDRHIRDVPVPAPVNAPSPGSAHDSYITALRIAATGSVSSRATSLPPPAL